MKLQGKQIAMLVADLYQEIEFWYPYYRMIEEGAKVTVFGPEATRYTSKHGVPVQADRPSVDLKPSDYQAVIIPGGYAPDFMRRDPAMVQFVKRMHDEGKTVAAICHAGWVLASAGILKGHTATSYHSIRDDVINAGAEWVDREVVRDRNLITSRSPADLPAFCRTIIEALQ